MNKSRTVSVQVAAVAFGLLAMSAQTLLLRRFLWRFEAAETGVALFLSSWLLWTGLGAASAASRWGRLCVSFLSSSPWLVITLCAGLYFVQYSLISHLRAWLGVPEYQTFPVLHLAVGCLLANAPLCFFAGWVVPTLGRCAEREELPVSRVFAWEALGAALGGAGLLALLMSGRVPDPRDEAEWFRYFPQAQERPGRFETGGGATFYGSHGGTFYAVSSGGVSDVIPEGDRAVETAALILSQRPYAKTALLLGDVPLSTGLALEALRPDMTITWCPGDGEYGKRLMAAVPSQTRIQAAGEAPQRYLPQQRPGVFDAVLVGFPPATSLGGAVCRRPDFVREIRRVTHRTGIALFGLDCDVATLTVEKTALLEATVQTLRHVWPESGCFAAGAGGWWIAAQVPRLAYPGDEAAARFALLKRDTLFPTQAVVNLYDSVRAKRLAQQCPALDQAQDVLLPDGKTAEELLALGLADALREEYPSFKPGLWLTNLKRNDGARLLAFLLVILWTLPVVSGSGQTASQRLTASWLAACGALGLAVSLSLLYQLQMRFGSLYLLAGAGSSLYLGGLFCGNRLGEWMLRPVVDRTGLVRWGAVAITLLQTVTALGGLTVAEQANTEYGIMGWCLLVGGTAGLTVPVAFAVNGGDQSRGAAVFVAADAAGAAIAGVYLVLMVPLAGLLSAVSSLALLGCGLAVCAALCGAHARLAAGLALASALAVAGGRIRECWMARPGVERDTPSQAQTVQVHRVTRSADETVNRGVPRKLNEAYILDQMRKGQLATNTASFWE